MKRKFLTFITAAAVFLCTLNASAASVAPTAGMVKENGIISADGKVTFIVEVEGDPVLSDIQAMEQGASVYGNSAKAKSYRDKLLKVQSEVQSDIMETVPDAKKNFTYTNVFNGFSIEADISDLDTISSLPNVKNVYISQELPVPEITRTSSDGLINTNYAYDDLGYHGEGRVICIIDSEFDTNHVFFQSDIENAKYKYEDIGNLLRNMKNINAQVNNEVNRVYKNEKIPIAFDYCDNDSDTYPENTNVIHGTHVAGIAAGKNGTAPDGSKFSGIAPEAQLILLKAGNGSGLSDAAILAALEDSAVIDVDVINMSLGAAYVYNKPIWDKALSVARGSGITVCVSAGNDERGYDSKTPLTTNIEYSADGAPSKTKDAFSIASAQNISSWSVLGKLTVNGEDISFMNTSGSSTAFDAAFSEKTIELLYCGYGT